MDRENYPQKHYGDAAGQLVNSALAPGRSVNPTFRENIDQRIQMHKDEVERLEKIKAQLPQLLDVNLRDLREAMQF